MRTKNTHGVEIKSADQGIVKAVFSTFDVIDKDGDITQHGAFTDGEEVRISAYGHRSWGGDLPVGKGVIKQEDNRAVFEGQFFLDTQAGKDTFNVVKQMGDLQEWSYGFDITESEEATRDGTPVRIIKKVKVHEVSPVMIGAGVGTHTLEAKNSGNGDAPMNVNFKAGIRPHSTATTTREWDGPGVVASVPDDASVSNLRSVFAYVDSNGDPENKSAYKFPHHHGVDGPANIRACISGIAALNGARGGADIPDGDREAVYEHLARHLRDADREPPELQSRNDSGTLKLSDDLMSVLADVQRVSERVREVRALRLSKGKSEPASRVNTEVLQWLHEDCGKLGRRMKELISAANESVANERVRFIAEELRRQDD